MVRKFIFKLGIKFRNPSLFGFYKDMLNTDFATEEELSRIQEQKFIKLINHAFIYSSFFNQKCRKLGLELADIQSLDDLSKLPIIDKNDLLENAEKNNSTYKFSKIIVSETSGTSGQPLKFNKNEEWDSMNRAAMFRGYSWYGVKPWQKNGYFWGYNIDPKARKKIKLLDSLQNRFRVFSYTESEILSFTKKLEKAVYMGGYSSMIYEVAKRVNSIEGITKPKGIKMIKGTAEKIYDNYHAETIKAFGSKIISEYGSAETGLIAFECPEGFMHINAENVIVEVKDGEILVTNLMSHSFPIIRYKLGDKVSLADKDFKCKCGRNHPVVLDVLGRVGKNVIGYDDTYPSLTFYNVFKNIALKYNIILNYQAIQNEPGRILLKIEQNKPKALLLLNNELKKYFKNDVDFEILFNSNLHTMDGKLKDFITSLE